ncbi:MAG: thioredoxin family protein [Deltaproteobacteria bacterium]|nr:thioredoxin family protein [Deltaproteobacteria bacterium]
MFGIRWEIIGWRFPLLLFVLAILACNTSYALYPRVLPHQAKSLPPTTINNNPPSLSHQNRNEGLASRSHHGGSIVAQVGEKSNAHEGTQEGAVDASIWFTLFVLFLSGLALNLTPCVYPLIPITISYFGGKGQRIRGQTIVHGLLYMFGLAVTNSLLGLSAALSGGMLGFALQHPIVLIFVAAVIVAMGLSFFGLWELRLPLWLTRAASKGFAGFFGTFFMGLTLGIVAAPCIGPFILGLLVYIGQLGDPLLGLLYFFVLSIGLGLPLAVLAIFSGAMVRLPKSGEWMLWIRKLMGWVLFFMAAFMIGPVLSNPTLKAGLLTAVAIAAGIHLGWLDRSWGRHGIPFYLKKAIGLGILCGALLYLAVSLKPVGKIEWVAYDQAVLSKASEEGKPVILEFFAEWCAPCRIMERDVFTDPEAVKLSKNFIAVRVDLTNVKPFHDELLRRYQIRGIPSAILFNRDGVEQRDLRIEGYVDKDEFLQRLRRLLENQ